MAWIAINHERPPTEHVVLFTDGCAVFLGKMSDDGSIKKHAYLVPCLHDVHFDADYYIEVDDFNSEVSCPISFEEFCKKFLGE